MEIGGERQAGAGAITRECIMAEAELLFEVRDKIATITFNRPEKLNAWTLTMDMEYRALMDELDKRDDVRVIVITGAGRAFCSGADMGLLGTAQSGALDDGMDEYARQTVAREGHMEILKRKIRGGNVTKTIVAAAIAAVAIMLLCRPVSHVTAQAYTETEVKAAFIYKFTSFIEWPKESFPDKSSRFRIGILGDDPFGTALDDALKGKQAQEHAIEVVRAEKCDDLLECNIVYISPSEKDNYAEILEKFLTRSILTIGDSDGFAAIGGIINLVKVDNKIRFEVNLSAARKANLKISSQLLKIAPKVYDDEPPRKEQK